MAPDEPQPLLVAVPTRNGMMMIVTVLELMELGRVLERPVHFVTSEASNIPRARNIVLAQLRDRHAVAVRPWVLWIDTDIIMPSGGHKVIIPALRWAEEHETAVVANYLMANGESVLMQGSDRYTAEHLTSEAVAALTDYEEVAMTGFGFLYVRQPLTYTFHADVYGEDIHFWWDNPTIRPHVARQILLGHKKDVVLAPDRLGPESATKKGDRRPDGA